MKRNPALAPLAALLALAACASPPTTLLTLDAAAPMPDAVHADYRGLPLIVPAVHLPASLDRAEFLREETAGMVKVDDFARWTAPLGLLARDALVRDLTARLPAGAVLPPGTGASSGHAQTLDVTILSFQVASGGATMQAAYRALPNGTVQIVSLSAPDAGTTPVATSRALGTLIGQLADRIATAMAARR